MASAEHQRLLAQSALEHDESAKVLATAPEWSRYSEVSGSSAALLQSLHGASAEQQLAACTNAGAAAVSDALARSMQISDAHAPAYSLTLVAELVRSNAAAYSLLVPTALVPALQQFLSRSGLQAHASDRAAFLLTALLWQAGSNAKAATVTDVVSSLISRKYQVSEVGLLDALVNLLKHTDLRKTAWSAPGVQSKVLDFHADTATPVLYKCVFAIWMVSCEEALLTDLMSLGAIAQLRKTIATNRTEKVVRVALLALKNLLAHEATAEQVVEVGGLEAVEALEYEKWRDSEVYTHIKSVTSSMQTALAAHSNFQRYQREIQKPQLRWGFIHSEKFWVDNYTHFDKDNFSAVTRLVDIVSDSNKDAETLAVACHDLGEFARLHPSGKSVLGKLPRAKAAVMERMTHENREVAREALLSVQKLMLNRWQDLAVV